MAKLLEELNDLVWGAPALILILGVGLYLTVRLGFAQLVLLPRGLRLFCSRLRPGKSRSQGVSSFQALCTALAGTVGTGNLVGVAGAICLGGPGAVFWMWVCGILGMVTKYAETVLAVRYRIRRKTGYAGGPMYVITRGLGERWRGLARLYSIFGIAAAFGVGNATQINSVVAGIRSVSIAAGKPLPPIGNALIGLMLALLIGAILLGGAKRIGEAAERLVPFAAAGYMLLCLGVLAVKAGEIPRALAAIVRGAVSPKAVTGGMLGSAFQALRVGCSRGVFTNEAGMGTASIAHASAEVSHPAEQGLMGIVEVFLDTIVICTLTALVILLSGVPIPYGRDGGAELTSAAFCAVCGEGASAVIALALMLFAVATVLGWGLYGARCAEFLFGTGSWRPFAFAQTAAVFLGAVLDAGLVWQLSGILNGMMVIPNLIAVAMLTPEVHRLTKEYRKSGSRTAGGGNYADFHQRKPLRTLSHAQVPSSGGGSKKRGQEDLPSEYRPARPAHS